MYQKLKLIFIFWILLSSLACSSQSAIIIDEKTSTAEELSALNETQIYSKQRWPKGNVPPKYSEFAEKGIIIVTTKAYQEKLQKEIYTLLKQKISEYEQTKGKLFVYNGIEVPSEKINNLKKTNLSDLQTVEILTLENAQIIYGNKAQKENILITTKIVDKNTILD